MSNQLINTYYNALHRFKQYGGSENETTLEHAFISLVNSYAEKQHLLLVPKISVEGKKGNKIIPDGVLKNALRLEFGCWESKDSKDDLDKEIHKKLYEDGYPDRNILFEDTKMAVLIQEGAEVMRVSMEDAERLDEILNHFIRFEPLQVKEFNKALEQFKRDVPEIVKNLRELIEKQAEANKDFKEKRDRFLELAQLEINPEITLEDIREMLIQHILTEDIFDNVFGNAQFHRFNNIARELEAVLNTFMDYSVRQTHLQSIRSYYDAIRNASSQLADHHEKQNFLKQIYENFYKVYNPKGADRLGVVYTPNEIVRFMIESTDWLLDKHFGKSLGSKGVEILDPATGTGTFVAELIEYINPHELKYKYLNEIHANEVAILPYYIANLNIEYTYQQKMNDYQMFENICFVDTLDNIEALDYRHKQLHMFGISSENAKRIQNQNKRKISVIIGNPPYRANQRNFNDFNANRDYKEIDERIKDTFVKVSTAQKNKSYDMYSRFYRWSMDRVSKNGIICFVSNNSFIDADSHDGFRKCAEKDFNEIWLINLKGDARTRGERRKKEGGNIFNDKIREGIAIYFLIKNEEKTGCKINYYEITDYAKAFEKIDFLRSNKFTDLNFEKIIPDKDSNWLNLPEDNDYSTLMALADERNKVFDFNYIGVSTNRDEWVYDSNEQNLTRSHLKNSLIKFTDGRT